VIDLFVEFTEFGIDEAGLSTMSGNGFLGFKPMTGDAEDGGFIARDLAGCHEFLGASDGDAAGSFRKNALACG
jgi:hypothetical protein